jgi:hypothetical protein
MKPRKPKPERWYKTSPEEEIEGTDKPKINLTDYVNSSATLGLGGNSIEERLGQIQYLLKKISNSLSFITGVIIVGLIIGFFGALSNS